MRLGDWRLETGLLGLVIIFGLAALFLLAALAGLPAAGAMPALTQTPSRTPSSFAHLPIVRYDFTATPPTPPTPCLLYTSPSPRD